MGSHAALARDVRFPRTPNRVRPCNTATVPLHRMTADARAPDAGKLHDDTATEDAGHDAAKRSVSQIHRLRRAWIKSRLGCIEPAASESHASSLNSNLYVKGLHGLSLLGRLSWRPFEPWIDELPRRQG